MASKTILIADDSVTHRQLLRATLESSSYAVVEAASGTAALSLAASSRVDLFILDVNMPGKSGVDVAAELRRMDNYVKTPIFILTTQDAPELVARGKSLGASWMTKPFSPKALMQGVTKLLGS
jgi:DNA-binding response OmpR family regulator